MSNFVRSFLRKGGGLLALCLFFFSFSVWGQTHAEIISHLKQLDLEIVDASQILVRPNMCYEKRGIEILYGV